MHDEEENRHDDERKALQINVECPSILSPASLVQ
jgi:hypothetical protein